MVRSSRASSLDSGIEAVRGSSTRGGALALRELIRLGRSGADLVVTPDGPKGPRQVAKLGVVQLAKATGLPIVPLAFSCSKKLFASWDRFMVPYPWSRGLYLLGRPHLGPRNSMMNRRWRHACLELETVLNRLTDQAEEAVKGETQVLSVERQESSSIRPTLPSRRRRTVIVGRIQCSDLFHVLRRLSPKAQSHVASLLQCRALLIVSPVIRGGTAGQTTVPSRIASTAGTRK